MTNKDNKNKPLPGVDKEEIDQVSNQTGMGKLVPEPQGNPSTTKSGGDIAGSDKTSIQKNKSSKSIKKHWVPGDDRANPNNPAND